VPWTETASGPSHEGKARTPYTDGASESPWNRTCPRWYLLSPEVGEVLAWLRDYKRGAMGPVQQIEAPLLDCLRVAEAEHEAWEAAQMASKRRQEPSGA
jgi:hypothetical protein